MMRDPVPRQTIVGLIAYLEAKLAAMADESHPV